ncbi:MAG: hypothetical protein NC453_10215 [Muribaculum sp.]|nr:hypothetical protein [Muribaculum sp.]
MLRRILTIVILFVALCPVCHRAYGQMQAGQVDIFMGVDFNYRDIHWHNSGPFEVLVNLTPGIKWNMGKRWEIAAQAYVPVINQYGDRYKNVRLNMAVLSKQMAFGDRFKMKATGGLFGSDRYGLDLKAMFLLNPWLALSGDFGFTGYCSMANGWEASKMGRFTAIAGPELWLAPWQTQIAVRGGRFLYEDYGVIGEGFRHFKHVSVGAYAQYSNIGKENFGFKIIVMLPPYKRTRRKVNFRPASNFRITYNNDADDYSNRSYFTDPEQNEREGWFDRDLLPWGNNTIPTDFKYKEKEVKK